jgi:hypothetical protein
MSKFNGKKTQPVDFPLVKQIAGRAGRSGTQYENGQVTTLHGKDMDYLRRALETVDTPVVKAFVGPSLAQIEGYALSAGLEGNTETSTSPLLETSTSTGKDDGSQTNVNAPPPPEESIGELVWDVDNMAIMEQTASGETKVLENLETLCNTGEEYRINSMDEFKLKAKALSAIPKIPMADLHTLCIAPVNARKQGELKKFFHMSHQV